MEWVFGRMCLFLNGVWKIFVNLGIGGEFDK